MSGAGLRKSMAATRTGFVVCRPKGLVYAMRRRRGKCSAAGAWWVGIPIHAARHPLQLGRKLSECESFMNNRRCTLVVALVLFASPALRGQATLSDINQRLVDLGGLPRPPAPMDGSAPPRPTRITDDQRPPVILQLSKDINSLPPGAARSEER